MSVPSPPDDAHELLWEESYRIYYDAYFEQLLAEKLLRRWYWTDLWSRLLVAVTASGSAIAAWAVWNLAGFHLVWAVVAGVAALVSVVHSVLNVPIRLKELSDHRLAFLSIRNEAETLRRRMRMKPAFPVRKCAIEIERLSKMYAVAVSGLNVDVFRTRRMENSVQAELNAIIADQLVLPGEE